MVKKAEVCPLCERGTLRRAKVRETMFGVDLGEFDADVCNACEERIFDEAAAKLMEARARKAGIWGLGRKLKVVRSGNSLAVRIPADLAKFLHLKAGREVFVRPDGEDRIVVEVED
jgi:hypothetical protein